MAAFEVRFRFNGMCNKLNAFATAKEALTNLRLDGYDVDLADVHPTTADDESDYPAWKD